MSRRKSVLKSAVIEVVESRLMFAGNVPAAPTFLGAVFDSSVIRRMMLSWDDNSTDETSFRIESASWPYNTVQPANLVWTPVFNPVANVTSAAVSVSNDPANIIYRVSAVNDTGASSPALSSVLSIRGRVFAPQLTSITSAGPGAVQVNWIDNSDNEANFIAGAVVVSGSSGESTTVPANATFAVIENLTQGETYNVTVAAVLDNSDSGVTFMQEFTVPIAQPSDKPISPSDLNAEVLTGKSVKLSWDDNSSNETGFKIERRYENWVWGQVAIVGADTTSYTETGLYPGVIYEYRVRATNSAGDSAYTALAKANMQASVAVDKAAPSNLKAVTINSRVALTWKNNAPTATSFVIERRYSNWVWDTTFTASATTTNFIDASVWAGVEYEYRIKAVTASGETQYSNLALIKVI